MAQDQYGYLWIGTQGGGVDYFDGETFNNICSERGLSYSRIISLHATAQNSIVCGLQNHFFSIVNRDTVLNFDTVPIYGKTTVTCFSNAPVDQTIWFANNKGDLFKFDKDLNFKHVVNVGFPVNALLVLPNENILLATNKGLFIYEDTSVFEEPFFNELQIGQIAKSHDGVIWVATNKGMVYQSMGNWVWATTLNQDLKNLVTSIVPVSGSEVWFGTFGSGVVKWDGRETLILDAKNGLQNVFCRALVHDPLGNIWIGTDGGGLIKYGGDQFFHYFRDDNPSYESVMSISQDNNKNYWFGTFGAGITILDESGESSPFVNNAALPSQVIYGIEHLSDGRKIIASKLANLVEITAKGNHVKPFKTPEGELIFGAVVLRNENDRLWVGTIDDGLYIINDNKSLHLLKELPSSNIKAIYVAHNEHVWIGTEDAGCFSISLSQINSYFEHRISKDEIIINPISLLNNMMVFGITMDKNSNLWIGTFGSGLYCIKPNNDIENYSVKNGMLSNNVYSIYSDDNNVVWVGTDRGIHQLTYHQLINGAIIKSYGVNEGFVGLECNFDALFIDHKKQLWIGNTSGVSVFNPNSEPTPIYIVQLHFTDIFLQGNESRFCYPASRAKERIVIPYSENSVTFGFAAIDLNSSTDIMYSYMLENFDADWQTPTKIRHARYSFVPAGEYIFKVKTVSKSGVVASSQIEISIAVESPFWQTTWFYFLMVASVLLLIYLYFRFRQIALVRRNKLLKELVGSRTVELQIETMRVQQQGEELRAQAENLSAINDQLQKLSIVASKTDNAVLIANEKFECEWVNEGFVKMYGYDLEQFILQRGLTIQESSASKKIDFVIQEALENKKSVVYSSRTVTGEGKELWVQSTLTPIYDDNQELSMVVVIDVDITHIKQINNELRKLSLVASKTDNSVIIMNKHGEIEWVNEGFHRMYDLSLEDFKNLYGTTIFELHHDVRSLKKIQELYETNQTQSFISKFTNSNGFYKWIQTVLTPIISPGQIYEQLIAVETDITRIKEAEEQLIVEKEKSDKLLKNILPEETAEELKSKGYATPRYYKSVSVLFADIKSFSSYSQDLAPQELLNSLNDYFNVFDEIVKRNFVEKIKTIGDSYMCAGGLPIPNRSHTFNVILVGLQIQQSSKLINEKRRIEGKIAWEFRVGIHTGEIISGVIGKQKFAYDIWGDTVNIASRLEGSCETGKVNISGVTYEAVKNYFDCEHRGKIDIKNRGNIDMYFVNGIKAEFSVNGDGFTPNERFKLFLAEL